MPANSCCIPRASADNFHFLKRALVLLGILSTAISARIDRSKRTSLVQNLNDKSKLKVRLWTWNSGGLSSKLEKVSYENAARKLLGYNGNHSQEDSANDVNIVVSCQIEAKASLRKYIPEDVAKNWTLISYAEHWGMAGGEMNAQILSVFLRQPVNDTYNVEHPPENEWGWWAARDVRMREAKIPGLMYIRTKSHSTSFSGKGGASAILTFYRKDLPPRKVAFMCAHLDSESSDQRRKGMVEQMAEALGWNSAYFRGKNKIGLCNLFDKDRKDCDVVERVQEKDSPERTKYKTDPDDLPVDAGVIVGDLNYRTIYTLANGNRTDLLPEETRNSVEIPRLVFDEGGRKQLATLDPLNPDSVEPEYLIQPSPLGLEFKCNVPYKSLPSYKRLGDAFCAHLHRQLAVCNAIAESILSGSRFQDTTSCKKDNLFRLTQLCFAPDGKWGLKGDGKVKNKFLQLGWLDRVCYRTVRGSTMSMKIVHERGWDAQTGSDHAPAEATLEFEDDGLSVAPVNSSDAPSIGFSLYVLIACTVFYCLL